MIDWSAGPAAEQIGDLFWAMTILGAIVFVIFCLALAYALRHRRGQVDPPTLEADRRSTRMILLYGGLIPALILVPLFIWTVSTLDAIDPRSRRPDLVVDLAGKQWWWEVRYRDSVPGRVFTTANELSAAAGIDLPPFEVARVGVRRRVTTSQGLKVPVAVLDDAHTRDWLLIPAIGYKMPEMLVPALDRPDVRDAGAALRACAASGASVAAACIGTSCFIRRRAD